MVADRLNSVDGSRGLTPKQIAALIGLGLVAGLFSGLFGAGGGLIIVPGLILALRVDPKLAVGTSLMAIVPACAVGIISYAVEGSVNWSVGLTVAIGAVIGAQIGARILDIIPRRYVQWVFIVFVMVMAVQVLIVVPSRDTELTWDTWRIVSLIVLGLFAGTASGMLGIGGGIIVTPIMMLLFGASDLVAKGVSLVMMLPGVLSGLIGNIRGGRVLVRSGLIIGLSAVVTGPFGAWIAHLLPVNIANICFAGYLIFVIVMMVRDVLRPRKLKPEPEAKPI